MRISILMSSILVSLLFCLVMGSISLAGNNNGNGKNCEKLLVPDPNLNGDVACFEYECRAIRDDGEEFKWELEFFVDSFLQSEFDSENEEDVEGVLGCQCKATGSFTNPKFDTSNWFHCVGPVSNEDNFSISIEGHVVANGDRIQQGEGVDEFGRSYVFEWDFEDVEECD